MLIEIQSKSRNGVVLSREYLHSKKKFIEKYCVGETSPTWKKALKIYFSLEPNNVVRTASETYCFVKGKVVREKRECCNV